ncbi:YqzE family protein [Bacillus horti]|uniref:YqzE family protein n=1 Tax=Caldalkalibacillus horti TaxID=77523 RepID=A0ABT9W100_9BACI|nr:YqzE family protein [Bacillus horti]MDQ0166917.1 hypothetical protein [Bacillus horti]
MSFQDLVKFMTQQAVQRMDTPKDVRKEQRRQKKEQQGHWKQHWFGLVPQALSMFFKKRR